MFELINQSINYLYFHKPYIITTVQMGHTYTGGYGV